MFIYYSPTPRNATPSESFSFEREHAFRCAKLQDCICLLTRRSLFWSGWNALRSALEA